MGPLPARSPRAAMDFLLECIGFPPDRDYDWLGDEALRRRMGEAGRLHARNHGWDRVARSVVECYASRPENT